MSSIEFQIVDWFSYHELEDVECLDKGNSSDKRSEEVFIIVIFGRMMNGEDICLRVTGYKPFFYIKYKDDWNAKNADYFISKLTKSVKYTTTKKTDLYKHDMSDSLLGYHTVTRKDFVGFANKKKSRFLELQFKSESAMKAFASATLWSNEKPAIYESNVDPILRFIHDKHIQPCGWITVKKSKMLKEPQYSHCTHSYSIDWKDVEPLKNDSIAPLKIMGYDIECVSSDTNFPIADRDGDEIIQIGVTMYKYGSMVCDEQYMLCLGECDDVPGTEVICYDTEMDLLMGYASLVKRLRPDIRTGYNNSGFDDEFIYHRIMYHEKKTKCKTLLMTFLTEIGKLNNHYIMETYGLEKSLSSYVIKTLASSALGDNILRFFDVPGVIMVDMMKVIQRDHSLDRYTLDNVSAVFIKEDVINVTRNDSSGIVEITTSTKALEPDSYIQIMVDDGYSPTPFLKDVKFLVKEIKTVDRNQVIVTTMPPHYWDELNDVMSDKQIKLFWAFAKDDMHHTQINKYYRANESDKMALVAKYCIKDCKLVNLLIAKLDIVVNSIGMANVCFVPFSFLFRRGQGIKIFSLVSKKCREEGFLIPVLKRPDENEDVYYEGAMVITPKPAVYLSPNAVLDFNSLYPNSERQANLSHESYVNDSKYDNLTGYVYHDVYINRKDRDGNIIRDMDRKPIIDHHRFAQELISDEQINEEMESYIHEATDGVEQKIIEISMMEIPKKEKIRLIEEQNVLLKKKINDEKLKRYNVVNGKMVRYGILPSIITELLNARKAVNARLEKETDPLIRSILNGRQLALKITANSLYGQTGAAVSKIFFLPIAASTTAIGRERLAHAKQIVEEHFEGSEVVYGDSVTADTPIIYKSNNKINITTIDVLGSSWTPYDQFKPNEKDRFNKEQCDSIDCEVWTANGWAKVKRVIRHKTVKKIYRVLTHTGCIDVTEDHSLLSSDGKIIKPTECVIGTELLHGFMDKSNESETSIVTYSIQGKLKSQYLFYHMKSLGYNMVIESVNDNTFSLHFSGSIPSNPHAIKKIQYLRDTTDEYVYDLETEDGTFHAGVGELIVKNTDSIFINFHVKDENGVELTDKTSLIKTIELAKQAASLINSKVPKPQCIVYEKTLYPMILVAKKKYVGMLYGDDPNKCYIKSMGIVLKRRDNAPIVKIAVGGIINKIIREKDIEGAVKHLITVLNKMLNGGYPVDKFVISKKLKANYEDPDKIAHKVLADRMGERDPGNKPNINDRIPFVYIYKPGDKKNVLQGDLVEHPDYVREYKLPIDYLFYIEHQIMNPAVQLLELVLPKKIIDKLFDKIISVEIAKRKKAVSLTNWMTNYKEENIEIKKHINVNRTSTEKTTQTTMNAWMGLEDEPVKKTKRKVNRKKKPTGPNMTQWLN